MKKPYKCSWATKTELESAYHDNEWGVPVTEDNTHFEMITLEGAQAGLSWYTVLLKREAYRKAFKNFDPHKVARFTEKITEKLLHNEGIVRNKQKILSTVNNANCFINIQKEFGSFNDYIWSFVNYSPIVNSWKKETDIPASTELSDIISKDMKKKGFKFVGTTTIYAYMQSIGIVNDHVKSCEHYSKIAKLQNDFKKRFKK